MGGKLDSAELQRPKGRVVREPTLRRPAPWFSGRPGCPCPCFRFPSKRKWSAGGGAGNACEAFPCGRLTDARRAPRQVPVTRGCRFGARWSTDGGPCASPALHRGDQYEDRRARLRLPTPRSTTPSIEQGGRIVRPDFRAGISSFCSAKGANPTRDARTGPRPALSRPHGEEPRAARRLEPWGRPILRNARKSALLRMRAEQASRRLASRPRVPGAAQHGSVSRAPARRARAAPRCW